VSISCSAVIASSDGFEAGHRQGNAVGILAGAQDVVGRVVFLGAESRRAAEMIEQAVETNGRAPERGKIEVAHCHILLEQYG